MGSCPQRGHDRCTDTAGPVLRPDRRDVTVAVMVMEVLSWEQKRYTGDLPIACRTRGSVDGVPELKAAMTSPTPHSNASSLVHRPCLHAVHGGLAGLTGADSCTQACSASHAG